MLSDKQLEVIKITISLSIGCIIGFLIWYGHYFLGWGFRGLM